MTKQQDNGKGPSTIAALARAVLAATPPSPAALRQAKLLLLDTIGCALLGTREPIAQAVLATCGNGSTVVIGRVTGTAMTEAVLANGVSLRLPDLNDYLVTIADGEPETGGHPSDNIPVALAVGSARAQSGRDILAAIVSGYEIYARIQHMLDRSGAWDGTTASGLVAPAIAGLLMGLDEKRLSHALALSLSRAAIPAIVRRGKLSASKSITNALVAQSGVQAALLAEQGITGPLAILDEAYGLRDIFAYPDMDALAAAMPADGAILRAHMKAYPCVNTCQSAAATALALREELRRGVESLDRIQITMADYPVVRRQQADKDRMWPQTRESADHSFLYVVAVSLIDGAFGLKQFGNERWRDPDVVALMEKMTLHTTDFRKAATLCPFPCAIRAWDKHGHEYATGPVDPPGASKDGLDETAVIAKFNANTEAFISRARRQTIVDAALEFDQSPSTEKLDAAIAIGEDNT